jgi:flagellar basal-body rod protein FlgF
LLAAGAILAAGLTVMVPAAAGPVNVNTADAMVTMIELSRRFDLQLKTIRTAEDNARSASSLLRVGG